MDESPKTADGRAAPERGQAALARALMLERFGEVTPSIDFDSDGHRNEERVEVRSPSRRARRRYRGWALASGGRR